MATVTVPTTSTLPVAGGDIIAAPLNGWITNLKTFVEGNNIDENNVDYSNSDGIVVMGQAQTITGLKTFENTSAAAGGVRTAAIFSIDPTSGTPTDGDGVEILFQADDDEGNVATIAELEAIMTDTDNGDEDSEVKLKALIAGSAVEFMVAGTPADGSGRVVFNDASADIDFRIETNNIANGFVVDAALDVFAFGAAGADDKFVTISPPAAAHATTVDTYALHITAGGAQTIPSGTTALVASVAIEEPNITATGTVTSAATLYIKNAPTEGGSNYALWVDDGAAKFDSTVTIADGSLTLGSTAVTSTAAELNLLDALDRGSILYGNASGVTAVLGQGGPGTVLTSDGTDISWSAEAGDITSVVAGVGLSGGGTSGAVTLTLDLSELSTVTPANGDFFSTLDSDGANEQKTSTTALATLFAGAGMTATSAVLNVIGGDGITANANDVAITAAQTTVTSVINAALALGRDADNQIKFGTDDQIVFEVAGGDGVTFKASGEIEATSLDISGDADIDGTLEADAITLGGTALGSLYSPIAGGSSIATTGTVTSGTWSGVIDGSATMTVGSDATGDVYFRDASGHLERLGASTDGHVLTTGGAGTAPAWEAAAAGGADLGTANTWTADQTFNDNVKVTLGTDGDADIYYDGTDLRVNPKVVGSGAFKVTGAGQMMEVTSTSASSHFVISNTSEAQNNDCSLIFNAVKDQSAGSTYSTAYIQSLTTNSGGALTGDLRFFTNGGDSSGERMRIDDEGIIGLNMADADAPAKDFFGAGQKGLATYGGDGQTSKIVIVSDGAAGDEQSGQLAFAEDDDQVIAASINHSHSTNKLTYDCISGLHEFSFNGARNAAIDQAKLFMYETANANQSIGATLNQATADNEILTLKSSDVAHGMTSLAETDTYGNWQKHDSTGGGCTWVGYTSTTAAINIIGRTSDNSTLKSTSARGCIETYSQTKSGTSVAAMGTDANLLVIRNASTTRFIFDAEGSGHADVEWTTFSDARLKKNIVDCPYGLAEVLQLEPKAFDKHSGKIEDGEVVLEENSRRMIGFLAQDVKALMPELVKDLPDDQSFYSLNDGKLAAVLVNAIQELNAKLEAN